MIKKSSYFTSMSDLEEQQDEVREEYQMIEKQLVANFLDPLKIGKKIISGFLGIRKNKQKTNEGRISKFVNKKTGNKHKTFNLADTPAEALPIQNTPVISSNKKTSFGKKIALSFLKWQAFNLAVWGGKKLYKRYQSNKAKHKLLHGLRKEL